MTTLPAKRRVLIVTGHHFAEAARKVDLHFMADTLRAGGDHVDFLACRLSVLSRFLRTVVSPMPGSVRSTAGTALPKGSRNSSGMRPSIR